MGRIHMQARHVYREYRELQLQRLIATLIGVALFSCSVIAKDFSVSLVCFAGGVLAVLSVIDMGRLLTSVKDQIKQLRG